MIFSKSGKINRSSLIEEEGLNKLIIHLINEFEKVSFKGETKDQTIIYFNHSDEIFNYKNYTKRKLIGLHIECSSDLEKMLDLRFEREDYLFIPTTIRYNLRYKDANWGFKFEDDIIQELKEFSPGYNILTYFNLTFGFPMLISLGMFFYSVLNHILYIYGYPYFYTVDNNQSYLPSSITILFFIVLCFSGFLFHKIRNYLFPSFFISIGQQKKEFIKRRKITNFVFGTVILSIALGVIRKYIGL